MQAQSRGQLLQLRQAVDWRVARVEPAVEVGAQADVLRATRGSCVVDDVLHHIVQGRSARRPQVVAVEADADDAASACNLSHRVISQLAVAGHDGTSVAVRGHDRTAPHAERVRHSLVGHVAQVEDDVLAPHRLQQLPAQLGQAARRAGAAAVPRRTPGRPDDPHAAVGPGAELGGRLDRVSTLHQ